MEGVYDYIEAYFTQTLGEEERKNFEKRCVNDKDFANEVAFYITSRQAIRQELLEQKQREWKALDAINEERHTIKPRSKIFIQRWYSSAAAACVILVTGLYFLLQSASTQQLAGDYINKNYLQLGVKMNPRPDSSQTAIEAYNNKEYNTALSLFEALEKSHPENSEEKKYAGLVYLVTKNYDKALQQFNELANMKGMFSNAGNFLKAITLMQRNAPGDKDRAKQLLQQIVKENTEGSGQAKEWLKKF